MRIPNDYKFQNAVSFVEIETLLLQYTWDYKGPSTAKKLEQMWRTYMPDIKTSHKTKRLKERNTGTREKINQQNRTKDLRHRPTLMWSHDL